MANREPAVVAVHLFADVIQVVGEYRWRRPVDVSLRDANDDLAQRVLDFATGLAHVDGGTVTRLDEHRYRLTPGFGSTPGTAGDREPRAPHPVTGAGGVVAPPDEGSTAVDVVSAQDLAYIDA